MFSLGCVLYEMLAGVAPFRRATETGTLSAILTEDPPALQIADQDVPRELERVMTKALAKGPESRYSSAGELEQALARVEDRLAPPPPIAVRSLLKARVLVPTVIIIAVAAVLMGRWLHRESRKSWARETAIPEIERLLNADDFHGAFDLARQARRYLPADPMLDAAWERIANTITFQTDPPGATVSYREFTDLDGPWVVLGETPLEAMPFPRGAYRWRIEKEGYEVFETKKSFFYSNDRGPLDAVVEPEGESPIAGREQWVTIDYLEERPDIDQTRVAYTGLSMGAGAIGRAALAYEDRFRAAMLWSGGFGRGGADYVEDAVGTVKRITVPTLMINGRYDYDLPVDTLQRPFFDLLATPDEYKRHMVFDSGHWPFPRGEFIRENLAWLDRYLGPVNE